MSEAPFQADVWPLAVVTGASKGIEPERAILRAKTGFDRKVAADEPPIRKSRRHDVAQGAVVDG